LPITTLIGLSNKNMQNELIYGVSQLGDNHRPSAVSIGNYDGVHLGHQHVIKTLLRESEALGAAATIVTFEPLAKEFFRPDSVLRLQSLEQRAEQLFELGVERVLCIDFTAEFANLSPMEFAQQVLLDGLGVRFLCVGDDFRFGKDRAGDFNFLERLGSQHNFDVSAHETFLIDGERVSSGRVRKALANGDFALAKKLIGKAYSISGVVSLGQQIGRTINFPTANIVLPSKNFAVNGVFVVQALMQDGRSINGVANVGNRPTVDGSENRLEVHLFDFEEQIYGEKLLVEFLHKIRDEQKFDSIELLKKQISLDAQSARRYFQQHG